MIRSEHKNVLFFCTNDDSGFFDFLFYQILSIEKSETKNLEEEKKIHLNCQYYLDLALNE